ncbi:MAG: SufD family Fe-S cluster assembly protein [Candidatus Methanoperedens sp.]|nr:SufD family Fe-S cluster assembly protein [Candidatus Methanoperedens sp.]MCZ7395990.1 SufD family Fe-S cluster assembly protein [Candidatus Methanoperedens sp.]
MSAVDVRERAKKAEKKPSAVGPDIDLNAFFAEAKEHGKVQGLKELSGEVKEKAISVGIDSEEACRSGSFFQMDHSVLLSSAFQSGIEVMSSTDALKKYDWLSDYWWKAVNVDADKYTAQAELKQNHGYFLRALPGTKVEFPLQACLYMTQEGLAQNVHNIIIAEEGSELHIITGCTTAPRVRKGLHIGVSEFYVKKNALVTFTMIHNWAQDVEVRPRTGTIVEENGVFLSNYVCMKPVKTLQMYPTAYCVGENATVRYNTILFAREGSNMDVGGRVFLRAKGSRAELVARAITKGGDIVTRGHLIGEVPGIKAHLECRGLILSEKGRIHAIPELEGKVSGVDMSHEAAVGKIAEEEIQYLMARGLNSDEATSAIVRGFLDVEIKGIPEHLKREIRKAVSMGEKEERLL